MNWPLLLRNQWFQLCLLVAVLSAGTTIYNLSRSNPNPNPNPNPNGNTNTTNSNSLPNRSAAPIPPPRRTVKHLTPKKRGQWILDSNNSRDSDGSDVEAIAASLSDGDVVTVRPGTYSGSCEITVSARFVGPSTQGAAKIRSTDPQRPCFSISGKKVSLENLSISFETAGDSGAMRIWRDSSVELTNCVMTTQSTFGVLVSENSSLSAQATNFAAPASGCCLKFEGVTRGTLTRCNFSAGRWGLEAVGGAQVQCNNCTFQNIGLINGVGLVMRIVGGRVSVRLDTCEFNGNTAPILVDEGASLQVYGSAFRNNGVTGEEGNTSVGVICAQAGAKVALKDDTFEDNKQGLVARNAGSLRLERVRMQRVGSSTNNQNLRGFCNAVGAIDQGSMVTVAGCTISDSLNDAFNISGGAHLKMIQTTITNSNECGLVLGFPKVGGSQAELNNVRFTGSHNDGILVNTGSQLELQNCQVSQSDLTGIEAQNSGTQVKLVDSTVTGCKEMGVNANNSAVIVASGSTMENTTRGAQAGLPNDAQKAGTVTLQNCTVRGNSVFGVGACRGATLDMRGGFLGNNRQNSFHEVGGTLRLSR